MLFTRDSPMRWPHLFHWLPSRTARRRRRTPTPPPLPRWRFVVPRLEQLESRTVPTTITSTSGSVFYNDPTTSGNQPTALTSAYVSYQITNNDGVNHPDVWATIGNFTAASGPTVLTLAPNAASAIDLGPLAAGQ